MLLGEWVKNDCLVRLEGVRGQARGDSERKVAEAERWTGWVTKTVGEEKRGRAEVGEVSLWFCTGGLHLWLGQCLFVPKLSQVLLSQRGSSLATLVDQAKAPGILDWMLDQIEDEG